MIQARHLEHLAVFALLVSACRSDASLPASKIAQAPLSFEPAAPGIGPAPESTTRPRLAPADSPTPEQARLLKSLKSQGPAPELSNQVWLNSPPLKLADLRGKVVVIDFWTFG